MPTGAAPARGTARASATIPTGATSSPSPSSSAATPAGGSARATKAGPRSPSAASRTWRGAGRSDARGEPPRPPRIHVPGLPSGAPDHAPKPDQAPEPQIRCGQSTGVPVLGLDAGRAPADLEDLPNLAADLDPLAVPERAVRAARYVLASRGRSCYRCFE